MYWKIHALMSLFFLKQMSKYALFFFLGSTLVNDCFFRIISSLKLLQDDDITKIANDYFQHQKEKYV